MFWRSSDVLLPGITTLNHIRLRVTACQWVYSYVFTVSVSATSTETQCLACAFLLN